jgi:formylglycine-generating enzyme required for sulfatase activity
MKFFFIKTISSIIFVTATLFIGTTFSSAATKAVETIDNLEFVRVKAGSYIMGDIYNTGLKYERPAHKVTLNSFYISRFEVTFDQYDAFCTATKRIKPSDEGWGRGSRPVINVSWEDAVAYAAWLSKKSGRKIRLPSESEWEYAARAGKSTDFWWGMNAGRNNANCKNCAVEWEGKMTAPVGSFLPNPFGLYDMNGNVYEWCQDLYVKTYKNAPTDGAPRVDGKSNERMMRGGSFYREAFEMRNSTRAWDDKESQLFEYGIRLVLEP